MKNVREGRSASAELDELHGVENYNESRNVVPTNRRKTSTPESVDHSTDDITASSETMNQGYYNVNMHTYGDWYPPVYAHSGHEGQPEVPGNVYGVYPSYPSMNVSPSLMASPAPRMGYGSSTGAYPEFPGQYPHSYPAGHPHQHHPGVPGVPSIQGYYPTQLGGPGGGGVSGTHAMYAGMAYYNTSGTGMLPPPAAGGNTMYPPSSYDVYDNPEQQGSMMASQDTVPRGDVNIGSTTTTRLGDSMLLEELREGGGGRMGGPPISYSGPGNPIMCNQLVPKEGPRKNCNLFVFHLPNRLTNNDLYELFSPFGEIISVRIMTDKETGHSKGFGFISYADPVSAVAAIHNLHGFKILGKRLKVQLKQEKMGGGDRSYANKETHRTVLAEHNTSYLHREGENYYQATTTTTTSSSNDGDSLSERVDTGDRSPDSSTSAPSPESTNGKDEGVVEGALKTIVVRNKNQGEAPAGTPSTPPSTPCADSATDTTTSTAYKSGSSSSSSSSSNTSGGGGDISSTYIRSETSTDVSKE